MALGITRRGRKEPLGFSLGSTENAVIRTDLVQDLHAGSPSTASLFPHTRRIKDMMRCRPAQ